MLRAAGKYRPSTANRQTRKPGALRSVRGVLLLGGSVHSSRSSPLALYCQTVSGVAYGFWIVAWDWCGLG